MNKAHKISLLLSMAFIANAVFGVSDTIFYPNGKQIRLAESHDTKTVEARFDVDEVLVHQKHEPVEFTKLFIASNRKLSLLKTMYWCYRHRNEIKQLEKTTNGFAIIDWIADNCPVLKEPVSNNYQTSVAERIKEIIAGGKSIPAVVGLLTFLKDKKYVITIATNREYAAFKYLADKGILPPLETYEVIYTPDYHELEANGVQETTALLKAKLHKKPSHEYYAGNQKAIAENLPHIQHSIFIDDKAKNVRAAAAAGILSVHFKNPDQLKRDLQELGVNIN